jgi:hypothetical protein
VINAEVHAPANVSGFPGFCGGASRPLRHPRSGEGKFQIWDPLAQTIGRDPRARQAFREVPRAGSRDGAQRFDLLLHDSGKLIDEHWIRIGQVDAEDRPSSLSLGSGHDPGYEQQQADAARYGAEHRTPVRRPSRSDGSTHNPTESLSIPISIPDLAVEPG